jgi:predicted porin
MTLHMNIKTLALGAALTLAAATGAHAQVTLYGRINLTAESQKSGGQTLRVLQNNSSRWGIKGSEDMGAGLKAGFQLESGFSADTGAAASSFWGRQSEVNLSGGFGTLRLGNFTSEAYYATADYVSNHNHDTGTSSDAFYAYIGRNGNKVAYRLPEFAKGLSLEAAVSLKETAASQTTDLALNWTIGDLQLGAGYEKNGTADQMAVRAYYSVGDFGVGGYVQRDKNAWGAASGSRTNTRLTAMYTPGQSEFHVNVGAAGKLGSMTDSDARQFTLGYNYKLSKRTKVYTFYTKVDDGAARVYGGDFSSVALGVRHNF